MAARTADKVRPKTLSDINSIVRTANNSPKSDVYSIADASILPVPNFTELQKTLDYINKMKVSEAERLAILEALNRELDKMPIKRKTVTKLVSEEVEKTRELLEIEKKRKQTVDETARAIRKDVIKALSGVLDKQKEIWKTSHDIQLQGNKSWREYTELYNAAYDVTRKMNSELGKQLVTADEIVKTQSALIQAGWKNIDSAALTSVASQAAMLTRVLGSFPVELQTAFQMSFRQFGSDTSTFMNRIGNSLNTFSNTFGLTVESLTQTVSSMMASNSLLARTNMNAQVAANQSLMKAVALTSEVGINNAAFITELSKIAQFGTAGQMSQIYQAGAYLRNFDTTAFQESLTNLDYEGATTRLVDAIYDTLGGMEQGYLRNEYISQISSGFGLSQDDILQIMTNGNNLSEYSAKLQDKMLEVDTSIENELKELRMSLEQQISNLVQNSGFSQAIGTIMGATGLFGINMLLGATNAQLLKLTAQGGISNLSNVLSGGGGSLLSLGAATNSFSGIGNIGSAQQLLQTPIMPVIAGGGAQSAAGVANAGAMAGMGSMARFAGAGLSIGAGYLANKAGAGIIAKNTEDNTLRDVAGYGLNIGGGAAAGAMAGAMLGGGVLSVPFAAVGGLIGAGAGLINSLNATSDKKTAMQELEDRAREDRAARARVDSNIQVQDPVVQAINNQTAALTGVIKGTAEDTRRTTFLIETSKKVQPK